MTRILPALALLSCLSASAIAADIPRPAPELTINMPGSRTIKIGDYKDKTRIVVFILTT